MNASGANVTNGTGLLSSNISYTDTTGATVSLTFSVLSLDITSMTNGALSQALSGVDSVLTQMTDAAADLGALNSRIDLQKGFVENLSDSIEKDLGALNSRIDLQKGFVENLSDSIEKGVGRLVDADMNEESTRLKALQTQQQLGIQALSIANSNSQNILSLFR
ncbi:hypothetical protein ASD49_15295 [Ensifer sp. Root1298]|nr:hypothetical protein ASD49_15295 [Ensifer sp. Root1298]